MLIGCAPKVKLVHFWAPWCTTCGVELEELKKFALKNGDSSIEIQAIAAFDSKEAVDKFLQGKEFPFPIVIDVDEAIVTKYEIKEIPTTIIENSDNKPLEVYDPLLHVYSSRFEGARSWASELMCRSLEDAVNKHVTTIKYP